MATRNGDGAEQFRAVDPPHWCARWRSGQHAQFLHVQGLQRQPPSALQLQDVTFLSLIGVAETMFILLLSMIGQKGY